MAVQEQPAPAPGAPDWQFHGRKLLIVDDQALNRAIARALVGDLGLEVLEAEHGQRALDMLRNGCRPDAVLMDVNMPGLNGIETTRAIRALTGPASARAGRCGHGQHRARGARGGAGRPACRRCCPSRSTATCWPRPSPRLFAAAAPDCTAAAPAPGQPSELLNHRRLDDFRRLGLLEEVLPEAVRDLHQLADRLRQNVLAGDAAAAAETLHALLGLSGEAGAQVLHGVARGYYACLLEQRQPQDAGWVDEIRSQLLAAEQALLQEYGVRAAPRTDGPQTSSHSLRV